MTSKKIVYLGGFYQAEFSMQKSLYENRVEMKFLFDTNPFGLNYWYDVIHKGYYKRYPFMQLISMNDLGEYLESCRPQVILQRYYKSDCLMHYEAVEVAKELGIPIVAIKMETTGNDTVSNLDRLNQYDFVLYVHDHDAELLRQAEVHSYFYPYGVSSFEKSCDTPKTKGIGIFGYFRNVQERIENIGMFMEGVVGSGHKAHVFLAHGNDPELDWGLYDGPGKNSLIYEPPFMQEQTIEIINQYKVILNIETLWHMEGMYSHKIWQSIGCGVPTLTYYKRSLQNLFTSLEIPVLNPIFIGDSKEVKHIVRWLLDSNKICQKIGDEGEIFIHQNFDWFRRMDEIMKQENVW